MAVRSLCGRGVVLLAAALLARGAMAQDMPQPLPQAVPLPADLRDDTQKLELQVPVPQPEQPGFNILDDTTTPSNSDSPASGIPEVQVCTQCPTKGSGDVNCDGVLDAKDAGVARDIVTAFATSANILEVASTIDFPKGKQPRRT